MIDVNTFTALVSCNTTEHDDSPLLQSHFFLFTSQASRLLAGLSCTNRGVLDKLGVYT